MRTKYKHLYVEVLQDQDPINPREDDNLGTMYCFHGRYNLGDKHKLSLEAVKEIEKCESYITLPLYLYDHSGITISTTPFSCPWDSGKVGIITVHSRDTEGLTDEQVRNALIAEVASYDDYLTGNIYGYQVTEPDGDEVYSCWGYQGSDAALRDAKDFVDNHQPRQLTLNIGE
jgi:hypothetical protein